MQSAICCAEALGVFWQTAGGAAATETAAVAPQGDPVSLAGVYTLPSSGAANAQAAYGNVFIAGKISGEAIRAKSYTGGYLPDFI